MSENNQLATVPQEPISSLSILEAATRGGVTSENVAVVKEIIAMRREEMASQAKIDFNRAFFGLKKEISAMEFYADKEAKTKGGATAYTYCSESEISAKLEPVLFKHGFAMLFGQRKEGALVIVEVTLIHESGHEEKREYSVRVGAANQMKDETAVDAGSTTSAWRHLVIKMFGLKSRIREEGDARNVGEFISPEKAAELRERAESCGADAKAFLSYAAASSFETIGQGRLESLETMLSRKERAKSALSASKEPEKTDEKGNFIF